VIWRKDFMLNTMVIFGTRPEAIKIVPIIKELEKHENIRNTGVVTAQHRQMLDQVPHFYKINIDYDLNIMKEGQSLFDVTCTGLSGIEQVFKKERPDIVLVQGDTTTTFVASLGAFYQRIPIAHVEAGLRTNKKFQPFPEEIK
jgi:UDP-N-acetylglucosamine 2-epimerase (non-hydrolysing)